MTLKAGQWELDGVVFGTGTRIAVRGWDVGGRDFRTQDRRVPHGGGRVFGRDEPNARTYTWDLLCEGEGGDPAADARLLERSLSSVWRGDPYRQSAGEVTELRTNVWGGGTVRLLGRPRRYKPVQGDVVLGMVPVTAEFAAVDDLFYADGAIRLNTHMYGLADTGLAGPWADPLMDSGTAEVKPGLLTNVPGDLPTRWIEVTFTGPVTNPSVEIEGVGSLTVQMFVPTGESVTLHVHPSFRKAVLNGSGDVSGKVVGNVDVFALPPGNQKVRYTAYAVNSMSEMTFIARPAFVSAR